MTWIVWVVPSALIAFSLVCANKVYIGASYVVTVPSFLGDTTPADANKIATVVYYLGNFPAAALALL